MSKKIQRAIRDVVEDTLSKAKVVRVDVVEDVDEDDNDILFVRVVYESKDDKLDPSELTKIPRLVRDKLGKLGEERFPVISYVSKSDFGALKPEAA